MTQIPPTPLDTLGEMVVLCTQLEIHLSNIKMMGGLEKHEDNLSKNIEVLKIDIHRIIHEHRPTHYVHKNSGNALFVKEASFFEEQGGLIEDWGKSWIPVIANSIGEARKQAAKIFDVKLSHIDYGEE